MLLTKHHGLGNDFLVWLDEGGSDDDLFTPELARRLCDRREGVGADGLIRARRPGDAGSDMHFDLLNSDGSRAEVSGNGLRCLAQAALAAGWFAAEGPITVSTVAGERLLRIEGDPSGPEIMVAVTMGPTVVGDIEVDELCHRVVPRAAASVNVGNPHIVLLVDDVTGIDPATLGPAYEQQVDGGVNVEWISRRGPSRLDLVVWERGAGVTRACGSGAVAAAVAASGWGIVASPIEVLMPGGAATVEVCDDPVLIGPSVFIADIEVL